MPDEKRVTTLLGSTSLFSVLDEGDLKRVAVTTTARQFRRGQFVFFEGDEASSLIVVMRGRLKLVVTSSGGDQLLLQVLGPPAVVGEIAVLDGGPRSATLEVLDDSEVVFIPAKEIWRLLGYHAGFVEVMLLQLVAMTRRLTGTTADLVFLDLPRRAAKLLVAVMKESDGEASLSGLTQSDLGARLGATRQSVNAALRTFVRRGWVELSRQRIKVLDADALDAFASSQ